MSITPQELEQYRTPGPDGNPQMSDEAIIKKVGLGNPTFLNQYKQAKSARLNFVDQYGEPLSTESAVLNMAAYGDPSGPKPGGQEGRDPLGGQGYLQNIGERFQRSFGNEEVKQGRKEVQGLSQGILPAIKDIPGDIADVAGPALDFGGMLLGGTLGGAGGAAAGAPTGPGAIATGTLGAMAGAGIGAGLMEQGRQSIGDLMGVNQKYGTTPEGKQPHFQSMNSLTDVGTQALSGAGAELGGRFVLGGISKLKPALIKAGATLTNVADDVLERAFSQPQMMTNAIQHVKNYAEKPFYALANNITKRMTGIIDSAKEGFRSAADSFKKSYPDAKFDINVPLDGLRKFLKDEANLDVVKAPPPPKPAPQVDKNGILIFNFAKPPVTPASGPVIGQGQFEPLPSEGITNLQKIVTKMTQSKPASPDDLLDVNNFFQKMYNSVSYDLNDNPTLYHRIVQKLKGIFDERVRSYMPDELQKAYTTFSDAHKLETQYGRYFLQNFAGSNVQKDSAESFLMRLNSLNKGTINEKMDELSKMIGIDIPTMSQFYNDAGKLLNAFPKTGNRSLDIIRAIGSAALGQAAFSGGEQRPAGVPALMGMGLGLAITSPKLVGNAAIGLGKMAGSTVGKAVLKQIPKLAPALQAEIYKLVHDYIQTKSTPAKPIDPSLYQ